MCNGTVCHGTKLKVVILSHRDKRTSSTRRFPWFRRYQICMYCTEKRDREKSVSKKIDIDKQKETIDRERERERDRERQRERDRVRHRQTERDTHSLQLLSFCLPIIRAGVTPAYVTSSPLVFPGYSSSRPLHRLSCVCCVSLGSLLRVFVSGLI